MAEEQIFVPAHWPAGVLQGVTRAMRRGRLLEADATGFLSRVPSFNIAIDRRSMADQWQDAQVLIGKYGLSAYVAAYLAVAKRLGVPLATLDGQLRLTADAEAVELAI